MIVYCRYLQIILGKIRCLVVDCYLQQPFSDSGSAYLISNRTSHAKHVDLIMRFIAALAHDA